MKKLIFLGILIVTGLVMISTTFTTIPIVAQSEINSTNMTGTDSTNTSETGQISKRK